MRCHANRCGITSVSGVSGKFRITIIIILKKCPVIILNILCTKSLILNLFLFVKQAFSRPTVDFGPFNGVLFVAQNPVVSANPI